MNSKVYQEALEVYGLETQIIVAIEECSELQKELTKYLRGNQNRQFIAEEIADVIIATEELRYYLDLGLSVETIKKIKIDRLKERLERAKNEKS